MFWWGLVIGAVVGFVVGILFGRRNPQKVEKGVSEVKEEIEKLKK